MAQRQPPPETSPWRVILSVVLAIVAVTRLIITCSHHNSRIPSASEIQDFQQSENNIQAEQFRAMEEGKRAHRVASRAKFYENYGTIDSLTDYQKKQFQIRKISKDSLVHFDLTGDFRLERGFYFQNDYDDSLRMAVRLPDMSIFFHDFASKGGELQNLKSLKSGYEIRNIKPEKFEKSNAFSYDFTFRGKPWRGFLLSLSNADYTSFIAFESDKLSKEEVRKEGLKFMLAHFQPNTKNAAQ